MSRIRARDTTPELRLRRLLWLCNLRGYRLHAKLPGKPDIVYNRKRLAVFIDGCFWHGCPTCGDGRLPTSNTTYWTEKRATNIARDARRTRELEALGWTVLRFWEHEVMKSPEMCVKKISDWLRNRGKIT